MLSLRTAAALLSRPVPAAASLALCLLSSPALAQCENDRLAAALADPSDEFGFSVAIDGDWALVGAPSAGTGLAGKATFFRRDGEGWVEDLSFGPPNPTFNDQFGAAVALKDDVAIVGAPRVDNAGPTNHGAAYVLRRVADVWSVEQILLADAPGANEDFGYAVAVDGDTALIGAPLTTLAGTPPFETSHGVAYAFNFDGASWIPGATFRAPVAVNKGVYGSSVSLFDNTAVIGSSNPTWQGMETAFAYLRTTDWNLIAEIQPPGFVTGERFSSTVAIENARILVGAPTAPGGGRVYVFESVGAGVVNLQDSLQPAGLAAGALFGNAIGISGDRLAVGAPGATPAAGEEGSVFLFEFDGALWPGSSTLSPSDAGTIGAFGSALAFDGDRLLVGAADGTSPNESGAAYEFQLAPEDCYLATDTKAISLSAGGTQIFSLSAGPSFGSLLFLVLGSTSGTAPGIPLGLSVLLPLNLDPYFITSITAANTPPFASTFGQLGPAGNGAAAFTLTPGFNPALAGLELHHAFVVLDGGTNAPIFASNARVLELLP